MIGASGLAAEHELWKEDLEKIGIVGKSASGRPIGSSGVFWYWAEHISQESRSWWVWGQPAAKLENRALATM